MVWWYATRKWPLVGLPQTQAGLEGLQSREPGKPYVFED